MGNYGNIHSLSYNTFTYDEENLYAFSRDSTGCLLVEYNAYEGTPTGFTKDISYLHPGGLAGGVYIDYESPPGCAMIGGTIQNELVFRYSLHEEHFPGWTPEGIWGYYIYKDDQVYDSIEIICDKWLMWTEYPEDTLPQSAEFSVSVKYELDMFGMEDQTTFSEKVGPVRSGFAYGYEMDFEEKWTSLGFTYRKWDTIGPRWEINTSLGNPAASACVRGISGNGPYTCTLQSYIFQPDSMEYCGTSLLYDIRVFDNSPSGNQTMQVDLWDSGSRSWQKLQEYHNDTVWDGFFTENIDITNKVKDRCFKFRFVAYGTNANDFQFWSIDNIKVKQSCHPPLNLTTVYDDNAEVVTLDWTSNFPEINRWIHHDDSLQYSSAGLATGPDIWCDAAIRWEKFSLDEFHNAVIEQIAFIPSDPETHYILKIWTGDSAKVLKVQKAVADLDIDQWNVIDLDEAVKINGAEELWIGYSFSAKGPDPISLDAGPVLDSLGNMCRIGNGDWTTLTDIFPGLDGNINIQAFIHKPEISPEGYRLYKSVGANPYQYLTDVSSSEYVDTEVTLNFMHCYKLQSVCTSSPDTMSSDFSSENCVLPVNIDENTYGFPDLIIFPNPATQKITIRAPENINQIELFDYSGRAVMTNKVSSNSMTVEIGTLNPGIYIIIVRTKNSSYFKKIVVNN